MITELKVGDRVLIDGEPYYINQVKNDDMGIYEARNISNNSVQVNIKDIGANSSKRGHMLRTNGALSPF